MRSVVVGLHCTSITQMFFDGNLVRAACCGRETWAKGLSMKKTYEKPVLSKREKLSSVVAIQGSGPI